MHQEENEKKNGRKDISDGSKSNVIFPIEIKCHLQT